jgi:dihydropteroate synthase
MGVLNVTPDSFSDGGRFRSPAAAIRHAEQMAAEGADLIDVGGESTRPGSEPVPLEEELNRVMPVIRALAKRLRAPISIDTSKAEVARRAIEAGASMVNDVTALRGDPAMPAVVARAGASVVLMHMRGTPATMQRRPRYRDVVAEVKAFLAEAIGRAERAGIAPERILIDPGLGFGKTLAHNLRLLQHLDELVALGRPVVIGPSRKSFIGRILDVETDDRLAGTLACVAYAMRQGAQVVRVHDVKPAVQVMTMWQAIERAHEARDQRGSRRNRASGPVRRVA